MNKKYKDRDYTRYFMLNPKTEIDTRVTIKDKLKQYEKQQKKDE